MKYLDIPSLALLSDSLTYESGECKVNARLEAYSCKVVRQERRLWKGLENEWKEELEGVEELSISPELKAQSLLSPFGPLDVKDSRQTHFLLVSTLNLSFPDYDFSKVKPERFEREVGGAKAVLGSLSGVVWAGARNHGDGSSPRSYGSYPAGLHATLSPPTTSASLPSHSILAAQSSTAATHPMLYKIINSVLELDDCVVYSYVPEFESDPHAEPEDDDLEDDMDFNGDGTFDDSGMEVDGDVSEDDGMMMSMDDDEFSSPRAIGAKRGRGQPPSPVVGGYSSDDGPRTPSAYETVGRGGRGGGLLWSVYYFFYNKKQKRILFLSVWAKKRSYGSPYLRASAVIPSRPVHVVPASSSPSYTSSNLLPISHMSSAFGKDLDGISPNLLGMATSIVTGSPFEKAGTPSNGSRVNPIRIGSATPSAVGGMTAAAVTLANVSAHGSVAGSPPPLSPGLASTAAAPGRGRGAPKLRRERSESTGTTQSNASGVGERLRDLAARRRNAKRARV